MTDREPTATTNLDKTSEPSRFRGSGRAICLMPVRSPRRPAS